MPICITTLCTTGRLVLDAFVEFAADEAPDAILQLGDFAYPKAENERVLRTFTRAHERSYHVLGNHEIDAGHTFDEVAELWKMPGRYYVAELDGLSLVVLDANEMPENHRGGYPAHIGKRSSVGWRVSSSHSRGRLSSSVINL